MIIEIQRALEISYHNKRGIMRLLWAIDELRTVYPKITGAQMSTFLTVVNSPGLGPTEYARMLGTVQPVASTYLAQLGPKRRQGPGLGLLDRRQDPKSLRQIEYHLTPAGHALAEKVAGIALGRGPTAL